MSDSKEYSFELKGHVAGHEDRWFSQDKVHYTNAKLLLDELLIVCQDINANWPVKENESIKAEDYPELFTLVKKRNLISDSVFLFSAMAIEGFLNFYGVLRLGEVVYKKNFERLNHISKLRLILLVCDSISIPDDHLLVKIAQKIS